MKTLFFRFSVLCASLAIAPLGCGRKAQPAPPPPPVTEAAQPVPEATPAPAAPTYQATQPAPPPPATSAAVPAQMNQAMAVYKAGNLEDAVTRLQKLRAATALTPQQRMALNDSMAAVMGEIYALAAKGDARAIAAVKQYEQMQTQRR